MDQLREHLPLLAISPETIETALNELKFEDVKMDLPDIADSKATTVDIKRLNPTSLDKCLKVFKKAGVKSHILEQIRIFIEVDICNELVCDSDIMFQLLLANLQLVGLPSNIAQGCTAIVKTKVGEDYPEYNPMVDLMLWAVKNMEHVCYVDCVIKYLDAQ